MCRSSMALFGLRLCQNTSQTNGASDGPNQNLPLGSIYPQPNFTNDPKHFAGVASLIQTLTNLAGGVSPPPKNPPNLSLGGPSSDGRSTAVGCRTVVGPQSDGHPSENFFFCLSGRKKFVNQSLRLCKLKASNDGKALPDYPKSCWGVLRLGTYAN